MHEYVFHHVNKTDAGSEHPVVKATQTSIQFHDDTVWTTVLDNFLDFLSNVYGYDIRSQVEYLSYEEKMAKLRESLGEY